MLVSTTGLKDLRCCVAISNACAAPMTLASSHRLPTKMIAVLDSNQHSSRFDPVFRITYGRLGPVVIKPLARRFVTQSSGYEGNGTDT